MDITLASREARRRQLFRFDPRLKLMTTIDDLGGGLIVDAKGAPEAVLARATTIHRGNQELPCTNADRDKAARVMTGYAAARPARPRVRLPPPARRGRRPGPARGRRT